MEGKNVVVFLNKGSGALHKARQMQKKPHILSLEDWTSFQFFWGNEKQSCLFHISYLNLVFYYQLNIKFQVNANACRFLSLRWEKKYHVQTGLVLHVIKCTAKVKWAVPMGPFWSPRCEADEYFGGCSWGLQPLGGDTGPQGHSLPSPLLASISASAIWFDVSSTKISPKDTIMASSLTFGIYSSDHCFLL